MSVSIKQILSKTTVQALMAVSVTAVGCAGFILGMLSAEQFLVLAVPAFMWAFKGGATSS